MARCVQSFRNFFYINQAENLLKNLITNILSNSIFRATCEIPYKFCQEKDFEVLNNFHFEFPFELNSVNT